VRKARDRQREDRVGDRERGLTMIVPIAFGTMCLTPTAVPAADHL